MKIYIKQATLENVAQVADLFNSYRVFYKQASDLDLAVKFITERIKNQESVIFLAHDEEQNGLGFTQLYPIFSSVSAQRSWVLNDLYVSKDARKIGVARTLMEAAKEFVLQTGANGIALETAEDNTNAQSLYESLGYKRSAGFYNYFLSLENA